MTDYRTLWLSDIHLGTKSSRADELLHFLEETSADRIYLVGDVIDLKCMKSRPLFMDQHLQVVSQLIALANRGTDVIYIPGNHDHEFRAIAGRDICGIPVQIEACHMTPDGKKLLVLQEIRSWLQEIGQQEKDLQVMVGGDWNSIILPADGPGVIDPQVQQRAVPLILSAPGQITSPPRPDNNTSKMVHFSKFFFAPFSTYFCPH